MFSSRRPPPPRPTLFPYTTLFRSRGDGSVRPDRGRDGGAGRPDRVQGRVDLARGEVLPPGDRELVVLEAAEPLVRVDRKSTRLNSSHPSISYAVFCLKKKNKRGQL